MRSFEKVIPDKCTHPQKDILEEVSQRERMVYLQWDATRLSKERGVNLDAGNRMEDYQRFSA